MAVCDILIYFVDLTGANQADGASMALLQDGSSVMSIDQLHVPELSRGNDATDNAAVKNEALLTADKRSQTAPVCSVSPLPHSTFTDPHIAFTTTLLSPVASSSPLPYVAAVPPAICHLECDPRHGESITGTLRLASESMPSYTLPVPSDAVLVRPRMPVVAGKHETKSSPPVTAPSLLLLSSATHDAGSGPLDACSQETGTSTATVYGGGFYAPPTNSSTRNHTDESAASAAAAASFSCCPYCGFVAAAVPHNIIYHPTGPSYVIHSLTPALQPCYSVTASSAVLRPSAAATYTAGSASIAQSPVRLSDATHQQQTCTRRAVPASPSFISSSLSSVNAVRVRTARPPPSCANCGHIGHTQLDCKQPTIDTVLNARK